MPIVYSPGLFSLVCSAPPLALPTGFLGTVKLFPLGLLALGGISLGPVIFLATDCMAVGRGEGVNSLSDIRIIQINE
jgi:uncharacterized PurR-regulated membrane protein YhhQ (DUF165 family)